ncbi:hypothetical protein OJAV_G00035430 [Oryzias javanicus]|uniref:Uncharacterized protein n=1 Tax=Oryzias javanicus TaxID=123683 RepID=A0A437DFS9_ORYJA|nr:hypothetical protein OJAV_G00035430 [Oryzias javanicus]
MPTSAWRRTDKLKGAPLYFHRTACREAGCSFGRCRSGEPSAFWTSVALKLPEFGNRWRSTLPWRCVCVCLVSTAFLECG